MISKSARTRRSGICAAGSREFDGSVSLHRDLLQRCECEGIAGRRLSMGCIAIVGDSRCSPGLAWGSPLGRSPARGTSGKIPLPDEAAIRPSRSIGPKIGPSMTPVPHNATAWPCCSGGLIRSGTDCDSGTSPAPPHTPWIITAATRRTSARRAGLNSAGGY